MESHILNSYHQARYRTIGHKIMHTKRDSLSSSECDSHSSPEYIQVSTRERMGFLGRVPAENINGDDWHTNQMINTTQSSTDTTSDEDSSQEDVDDEQNLVLQENNDVKVEVDEDLIDYEEIPCNFHDLHLANINYDDSLVEGHDYEVIAVYTVNPDLDLIEASSDDEKDDPPDCINENNVECVATDNNESYKFNHTSSTSPDIRQRVMDVLSRPAESSVDEYLLKTKSILDEDGPVVKDVDEYFIKETDKMDSVQNFDELFIQDKIKKEDKDAVATNNVQINLPGALLNEDEFSVNIANQLKQEPQIETEEPEDIADISINESDLEVLPKIEELKRYLLEDMSYTKFKNTQRSCSVPQTPMQNLFDVEDTKTCLSFEELNLDLSDLNFDNEKDKPNSANKSGCIPNTLTDEDVNSFLISMTAENKVSAKYEDDLSHQDMDIEQPIHSIIECPQSTEKKPPTTPLPSSKILNYCIEKSVKKEVDTKEDVEDYVDVEMCNDTVIPVLEANNLNSLLEQFEATEKLNLKKTRVKVEDKVISKNLSSGMRQQDAVVQLNKNKMRQILMPPTVNTSKNSASPVHSDHDYCSLKKRHSLPNLKRGQSLLKPEVLSSNNRILNSRHRSCKDKKIVYHLSSDDESEKSDNKNKKINNRVDNSNIKKKIIKQPIKPPAQSNCSKKLSPKHSIPNDYSDKGNSSRIIKNISKVADVQYNPNPNGSIKLTIKNKSEVILKNCDVKDSQKEKPIEKCISSISSHNDSTVNNVKEKYEKTKEIHTSKIEALSNIEIVKIKKEPHPKEENFYTALFSNKQDVKIPLSLSIKPEKNLFECELHKIEEEAIKKEHEQPLKKKKLNLQEYKLRKSINSNNSSTTVSPEAIFPDMPSPLVLDKIKVLTPQHNSKNESTITKLKIEEPKKVFDPIREASRKILMNTKKLKAEAMRKRDEDIVMRKIPKMQNLQLQPLISEAEMMKIVGMSAPEILPDPVVEKPRPLTDFQELILVSVGTNTDVNVFRHLNAQISKEKRRSSQIDSKSLIHFKIKKSAQVLQQNVFENMKKEKRCPTDEKKQEAKIDKERFKDIAATLKSVEKQVETKIFSNSLFASIQDVVMKKAPNEVEKPDNYKLIKLKTPDKRQIKTQKVTIVRDYDSKMEHGEDKVILHLPKNRSKPLSNSIVIQTDPVPEITNYVLKEKKRQRNDSDMSMSSEGSTTKNKHAKTEETPSRPKTDRIKEQTQSKEKRSRSIERYNSYKRRSRSSSRARRRRPSRTRSRSRRPYKRYRRSDSPYKRRRRSSYYNRRSPSARKDRHSNFRSRTKDQSRSPIAVKAKASPPTNFVDKKPLVESMTAQLRKQTVSESSHSSSSSSTSCSSSTLSSNSSKGSQKSCQSTISYKCEEPFKRKLYRNYCSEDSTPVEERRIVFVGRLEKDITKMALRNQFSKFGQVVEIRLHTKDDGSRYGFVTYMRACDAWSAVEAANTFPQYDVGFGGRRAFCRQSYADLDGLEAKYTESAFHGQASVPACRTDDMSFEQMLLDMKQKLSQRKNDMKRLEDGSRP